jgi:CIC family chloride channel protein
VTTPRTSWLRLGVALVVVALAAAGFAILFRWTLTAFMHALGGNDLVTIMSEATLWERLVLPACGGLVAGFIIVAAARVREGAGVGYVMEAIVLGRARIPLTRSLLQALASWFAIASGNSLGREGPLIQAGAAAGEAARRGFRLDDGSARLLLAAGVAAGFAAAYNAPIAAVLFVVEVVTGVIVLEAVVPVMVAVVIATVATRLVIGGGPIYGVLGFSSTSAYELFAFAGLGLLAAPVGVAFLRLLAIIDRGWRKIPMPWRPALGGLVCGAILCAMPLAAGNGYESLGAILNGKVAIGVIAWLLLAKPFATAASVGSGNPGGVFTPTLLIGGCLGVVYAAGLHHVLGDAIAEPGSYALVGLAATLAATMHAPLTAAILACEMSGDYALVLPLLIACSLASGLARHLYVDSVYTAELTKRGVRWRLTLDGRRVFEEPPQDYVV